MHSALRQIEGISYNFYELGSGVQGGYQYPAVDVANFGTLLGAKISAGLAFKYGDSVAEGIGELQAYINSVSADCPDTQYILAGHSQGGQVISSTLPKIDSRKVLYAATFGDPKLYLPEGRNRLDLGQPTACYGLYSSYRVDVPDCYVYTGILGGNIPYQPNGYYSRLGAWCNQNDFMCGSGFNFNDLLGAHVAYPTDGSFDAAAALAARRISNQQIGCTSGTCGAVIIINPSPPHALSASSLMNTGGGSLSNDDAAAAQGDGALQVASYRQSGSSAFVSLEKSDDVERVLVIAGGAILGFTTDTELEITDLSADTTLTFVPVLSTGRRGDSATVAYVAPAAPSSPASTEPTPGGTTSAAPMSSVTGATSVATPADTPALGGSTATNGSAAHFTPKAPNTGAR